MKTIAMRRSGKRIALNDRLANLFIRRGIATEEPEFVIKKSEIEEAGIKPKRRKYKRRDMIAEESECQNSSVFGEF